MNVQNLGDAVLAAVTEALQNLLGFLPILIGALLILIIGWIVAGLVAGLVERVLTRVGFERAAETTGIAGFVRRSGTDWPTSRIVAEIVKWFIRLIAIQAAASVLDMTAITAIINSIVLYLPNVVVAIVIVVIGALIARFVAGLVRGSTSEMGFANPNILASVAQYAILVFAAIAAINQLGIAETVVNTLFIGAVAATAGAVALAFGLGGQHVAAEITRDWHASSRSAAKKIAMATDTPSGGGPVAPAPETSPMDKGTDPSA